MGINSVIAQNLKRLRTERNLSLGQLAEAAAHLAVAQEA